ncbi:MAG TPA: hypothetical protein VJP87_04475 [Candidatus Acidoferrales bacterium]|nr:hypothetical protein [Candidatus Acidoferrales bacterium]
MRTWRVTLMVGILGAAVALPTAAQEKTAGTGQADSARLEGAPVGSNPETRVVRNAFALPETPRPNPFPAAAPDASKDNEAPGRLLPRYELAGMFMYIDMAPGDPFRNFNTYGATGSFTYNISPWLGLTGEGGGYNFNRNVFPLTGSNASLNGGLASFLFGPRLNWRKFDHFVPFGEFLIGGVHSGPEMTGTTSQGSFALATGGGVDVVLTKNIAWRFAQLDYFMTNFAGPGLNGTGRQNNFRAGSGIVVRWGFPKAPPPPPAPKPPVAACSANPTSVYQGSNDAATLHVDASSPDGLPLTYAYTATGGAVEGTGPDARWNSAGTAVGTYTVNVKVEDNKGGAASCAVDIKVEEKPNHPPTVSCSVDRSPILPGERATVTCNGSDPDNDSLTYTYTATGGQVVGSGPKVQFDSTGLSPGSYTVKCQVNDGRGGTADASTNVDVQEPPRPPQPTKVGDCGYAKPGVARFDNACKRVGDDVALRLSNDPSATLVIVGYADPMEPNAQKLATSRAQGAQAYLVKEKGIDASRVSTRSAIGAAGSTENRRVDFIIVPQGATYQ